MAWIESHQSLGDHPKTIKLARLLGIEVPHAMGLLHCLWHWALDYAQDGDLTDFDAADLALACKWGGDAGALYESLLSCGLGSKAGFIEQNEEGVVIHDWDEYAGKLISRRVANMRRMKAARNKEHVEDDQDTCNAQDEHVQRTCNAQNAHVQSDSTQPTKPTVPTKPKTFLSAQARTLFQFWRETMGKGETTLYTAERKTRILQRLKDGYSPEDIKKAIVNCSKDKFSMGENDRSKQFNDIELICRNGSKLEFFRDMASMQESSDRAVYEALRQKHLGGG